MAVASSIKEELKVYLKNQNILNQPPYVYICLLCIYFSFQGITCEVPFLGGSALFLFYSAGAMASCNYIYTTNNVK